MEEQAATPGWRKSSYSNGGSANCVEVGTWRKSSYSNGGSDNCVEVGRAQTAVLVRDTKDNGTGLTLRVTPSAWARFTTTIRTTSAPS
jgi:hypothetical protein